MARTSAASWCEKSSPDRASTKDDARSSSSGTVRAAHRPAPTTSIDRTSPLATRHSSASGTRPAGNPTDDRTRPDRTMAPTSASTASAMRSTAPAMAAASWRNEDTAARNSASCWADQSAPSSTGYASARTTSV